MRLRNNSSIFDKFKASSQTVGGVEITENAEECHFTSFFNLYWLQKVVHSKIVDIPDSIWCLLQWKRYIKMELTFLYTAVQYNALYERDLFISIVTWR